MADEDPRERLEKEDQSMLGVPFLDRALTSWFRPHLLDDPVDRLNYFVTTTLLTFFALMVSAKQYVGSPIQCWMPMEFRGGWEQYAEDYCFIQNTFYIPLENEIPKETDARQEAEIGYYQWVPIVLALQALMFYIPNWAWKTLNRQSGVDIECTVVDARKLRSVSMEGRREDLRRLTVYLAEALDLKAERNRGRRKFLCFNLGRNLGSYVSMLYLSTKFIYLVNVVAQIYLLSLFLGTSTHMWGFNVLWDIIAGREWTDSGIFPRVTLCDFGVRKLANLHRYTVQCVLMINMFNEKIYLFLWFWFMFVAFSTFINFFYSAYNLLFSRNRVNATREWLSFMLNSNDTDVYRDDLVVRRFALFGLQPDGILVLRFIEGHAGAMVAKEVACSLFKQFLEDHKPYLAAAPLPQKTTNPNDMEEGPHEQLYNPQKLA